MIVEPTTEASRKHLVHGAIVVAVGDALHMIGFVEPLVGQPVGKNDH